MYKKSTILFRLITVLAAALLTACTSSAVETSQEDMIQPGDMIGETVIRKTVDESETFPVLWHFCDAMLAALTDEKTEECVAAYQPTIFMGQGLGEADLEKRNEYWGNMTWEVSINGQQVDLESFGTIEALGGRFWNIVLENPPSDPLQIVTTITMNEDPNDRMRMTLYLSMTEAEIAESAQKANSALPTLSSAVNGGQHAYFSEEAQLDYLLYVPEDYEEDSQQEWPMIVFLHGMVPRSNIDKLRGIALPKILEDQGGLPFVVVSPRVLGEYEFWAEEKTINSLNTLLQEVETNLSVDPQRIYLTGESAGGYGTWTIGLRYPDRFAALAPAMGYYGWPFEVPENICDLKDVPVWAFHGAKDEIVPIDAEQRLVDALQDCGGDVQFTVYPEAGHDIEAMVYDNPDLFTWMSSQQLR